MSVQRDSIPRIAIVGGGISGLAAAHRLREIAPHVHVSLLEASERLGGVLGTDREGPYLIERSADMFSTAEPWAIRLCQRIGFDSQLIGTNEKFRGAFVLHRGRLERVPLGFSLMAPARISPVMLTRLLSWFGKLRLGCELFVPARKSDEDESLASFVRRRLGAEAYERIVQPLVGGIYTADPEKLSMAATLERFRKMEREHGGLIRGMWARERANPGTSAQTAGVRYSEFVAPRLGMQSLIEAIAARLPAETVSLNSPVSSLNCLPGGRWQLSVLGHRSEFDHVVLALPAWRSAELVRMVDSTLSRQLESIPFASAAVVVLVVRREQVQHQMNGFGFVVPIVERRRILAGSFSSVKFSGRAPDDEVVIRVFVGGALQPDLLNLDDSEIAQLAKSELGTILGLSGKPLLERVVRWNNAMPQYHVGHLQQVAEIEARLADFPTLHLIGNAYRGVGIPFCVRDGEQAAERIAHQRQEICHSQSQH